MDFLLEYAMFAVKAVTVVSAIIAVVAFIAAAARGNRDSGRGHLTVKKLNERYENMAQTLRHVVLSKREAKQWAHQQRAMKRDRNREIKHGGHPRKRVFVLNFDGDVRATAVSSLREEVTAVLTVATEHDEVLLRLSSGGGLVHTYGLAASQLTRLRDKNITLTVSVDKIAASGGYMMASVGHRVIAAPFAVVGSIGVVAQMPNFNRMLKHHNIDFEEHTAGEHKRTLTLFGVNTDEQRRKFQQDLEDVHGLFKDFVLKYRPNVSIDKVSTGEHWYGTRAIDLGLVDHLRTSDDYLLAASETADLYEVTYKPDTPWTERVAHAARSLVSSALG